MWIVVGFYAFDNNRHKPKEIYTTQIINRPSQSGSFWRLVYIVPYDHSLSYIVIHTFMYTLLYITHPPPPKKKKLLFLSDAIRFLYSSFWWTRLCNELVGRVYIYTGREGREYKRRPNPNVVTFLEKCSSGFFLLFYLSLFFCCFCFMDGVSIENLRQHGNEYGQ